jgi:hypothetical protein
MLARLPSRDADNVCLSEIEKMLSWVVNMFIANKALEEGTCDKRQ